MTIRTRLRTAAPSWGSAARRPQARPADRTDVLRRWRSSWTGTADGPATATCPWGHRAGAQALKRVVRAAGDAGIKDLTVFSFSTENWSRPLDEVDDLMGLFCELIDREVPELHAERVQIRFIGRCDDLDPALRAKIAEAEALTAENGRLRLFIAMNYGGRQEILDAARRFAIECGPDAGEAEFARMLYGPDMRDPELVIRTSGEQRLSNFLLWQSAYAELHFSPRLAGLH